MKSIYLCRWKPLVQKIAVAKLGTNDKGMAGTCCYGIKVRVDATKFTNTTTARLGRGENCIEKIEAII